MNSHASPPTRRATVALSVEALLRQRARESAAPAGAAVVADAEIAARGRGGIEWRTPDAVAVGVLARPSELDPDSADVAWLAASLAAVEALDAVRSGTRSCQWPDRIACEPDDGLNVSVNALWTLAPGQVDLAVLTARAGPLASPGERSELTDALLDHLRAAAERLDDRAALLDGYRRRCSTLGRALELRMLPHGTMRGTAEDIDETARLVLVSPTGLREQIAVATLNNIQFLPD